MTAVRMPHIPGDKADFGQWEPIFQLGNVAVHLHLLPTGEVLFWGRRADPYEKSDYYPTLNEHKTHVYILNLKDNNVRRTKHDPKTIDGLPTNLFCAGHSFLPDGTLIIFGGHVLDAFGEDQCCIYDPVAESFTPLPPMIQGRWYPTTITLPDGRALVASGASQGAIINIVPQIWNTQTGRYDSVAAPEKDIFSLFPRLYHSPDGRIFSAGPQKTSRFLDLTKRQGAGEWSGDDPKESPPRNEDLCEYAGSAMYDAGKILYVSGGGGDDKLPSKVADTIDLNEQTPYWKKTTDIHYGRRHHFATTLPDGTVLVTGGTKGVGFNNLEDFNPVHEPEIWDPATGKWTLMNPEDDDRCYHHTALLLPDGRVLSAGGGEYDPGNIRQPNPIKDTKTTAQIFNPPYMFKGPAPTVSGIPEIIQHGQKFTVTVGEDDKIAKVSLTRIGSVTHTLNMNQSFQFLNHTVEGNKVTITAPTNQYIAPAGHYMLFLVSEAGRPSTAPIIRLDPDVPIQIPRFESNHAEFSMPGDYYETAQIKLEKMIAQEDKGPIVVGLTPSCPYGLGACWGGANEALRGVSYVKSVRPIPDHGNSLAFVYLKEDVIPNVETFEKQFHATDGGSYTFRGIELTLEGTVAIHEGNLVLTHAASGKEVLLRQFSAQSKLEWDRMAKAPRAPEQGEVDANSRLYAEVAKPGASKDTKFEVTGRLNNVGEDEYSLDVRSFQVK